jgi:hypothetical protein
MSEHNGERQTTDVWAWCEPCQRWFFCSALDEEHGTRLHACPVCSAPSSQLQDDAIEQ